MTRAPLTPAQQTLASSARAWLWQELVRVPSWFRAALGWNSLRQEAWLAVCKAAADFDPVLHPGVPFGAFARRGVRMHFEGLREKRGRRVPVWRSMPVLDDGTQLDPADHRSAECDPALRLWCSPDYAAQRRCLPWRERVVLYLRAVEGWTLREVAAGMGVTPERVRHLQERAVAELAFRRNRDRLGRQLAGLERTVP